MYDGTLRADWEALITFQQMIILSDADGVVDMTPHAISGRTGIPLVHIENGIKVLESPDPYSRSAEQEGRRICLLDEHRPWGWYLVNHGKYKHLQDSDTVRAQTRERVRKHRERNKTVSNVTDGNGQKRYTDTDIDNIYDHSDTDPDTASGFSAFWSAYPRKLNKDKARKAWNRLTQTDRQKIMDHLPLREWPKDKQFIPYASSFLNARRWEDESESEPKENTFQGAL